MIDTGFFRGMRREVRRITGRKIYLFGMILVPLCVALFFIDFLGEGLPQRVPTAVVDLDHSQMSRSVTRSLQAMQMLDISMECESYDQALEYIRQGKVFGFFVIPEQFEKKVLSMRSPTLEYYSNMTYFVPGTLAFKGFKTVAVSTSAGVVKQTLSSVGVDPWQSSSMVQPLDVQLFALNNPWMSYAIYLCPSFTMATFALMIMLMTVLAVTSEIKHNTSKEWLADANGNIWIAIASKLIPHTVIYFAVGLFIQWLLFGAAQFPMHGSVWVMILATFLTVTASQAFGLMAASIVPNPRLALIICALFGILSFSFTGFSFPVESMYGFLGVFSWLAPVRYWFLIYINNALNGVALYYSRIWFVILILFPLLPCIFALRLRKACLNPVYVP